MTDRMRQDLTWMVAVLCVLGLLGRAALDTKPAVRAALPPGVGAPPPPCPLARAHAMAPPCVGSPWEHYHCLRHHGLHHHHCWHPHHHVPTIAGYCPGCVHGPHVQVVYVVAPAESLAAFRR
jgi:hypothetical protein